MEITDEMKLARAEQLAADNRMMAKRHRDQIAALHGDDPGAGASRDMLASAASARDDGAEGWDEIVEFYRAKIQDAKDHVFGKVQWTLEDIRKSFREGLGALGYDILQMHVTDDMMLERCGEDLDDAIREHMIEHGWGVLDAWVDDVIEHSHAQLGIRVCGRCGGGIMEADGKLVHRQPLGPAFEDGDGPESVPATWDHEAEDNKEEQVNG